MQVLEEWAHSTVVCEHLLSFFLSFWRSVHEQPQCVRCPLSFIPAAIVQGKGAAGSFAALRSSLPAGHTAFMSAPL
eukprot:1160428-Pelagomonas_calceolata.AAC.8